jgi:hypothetical protein
MPRQRVRAGLDQLVILLERDLRTPVAAAFVRRVPGGLCGQTRRISGDGGFERCEIGAENGFVMPVLRIGGKAAANAARTFGDLLIRVCGCVASSVCVKACALSAGGRYRWLGWTVRMSGTGGGRSRWYANAPASNSSPRTMNEATRYRDVRVERS